MGYLISSSSHRRWIFSFVRYRFCLWHFNSRRRWNQRSSRRHRNRDNPVDQRKATRSWRTWRIQGEQTAKICKSKEEDGQEREGGGRLSISLGKGCCWMCRVMSCCFAGVLSLQGQNNISLEREGKKALYLHTFNIKHCNGKPFILTSFLLLS